MKLVVVLGLLIGVISATPPTRPQLQGSFPDTHIVGGVPTKPGEIPYQGSLRINGGHICGCAVISEYWLLSAAHCVENSDQYVNKLGLSNIGRGICIKCEVDAANIG